MPSRTRSLPCRMTWASGVRPFTTWTSGPSVGPRTTGTVATFPSRTTSTLGPHLQHQLDPGVHPGLEQVIGVGDVDLHPHRPGSRVEGVDHPGDLAGEPL